eukprot:NODE_259_length_11524_cov_0.251028.p13 type:complete len:101 gc:universal NODE_259_length_11524_cov_0.251028:3269-2967(-)
MFFTTLFAIRFRCIDYWKNVHYLDEHIDFYNSRDQPFYSLRIEGSQILIENFGRKLIGTIKIDFLDGQYFYQFNRYSEHGWFDTDGDYFEYNRLRCTPES